MMLHRHFEAVRPAEGKPEEHGETKTEAKAQTGATERKPRKARADKE